jgi:carboxyl-terminal processing protease
MVLEYAVVNRQIPFDNDGMTSRTRALVFLMSTPLVVLVLVGGLLGQARVPQDETMRHLRVFTDVQHRIIGAYVEPANMESVMDGAMRGLAEGLDPASAYLTPDEVRFVQSGGSLPAGEVGLVLTRQYYLRVVGVRDGSAAAKAGLQSGDYIRAIDDTPTRDMSVFAGTRRLRGPVGSQVKLLVIRSNPADPHEITLTRGAASTDRVAARTLPGGEAYVRIASFETGAAAALARSVSSLAAAASGVIIDLREVADGAIAEGAAAARLFVKDGVVATRVTRSAPPEVVRARTGDGTLGMKVVLLVSNGTGRAAEVFAAALANNSRAEIVGEPTAGVASGQKLVPLPEGHGLWLTTERYIQADGSPLDGRGLRPTIMVETPAVDFSAPKPLEDVVLARGIEALHGRITGAPSPQPSTAASPASPDQQRRTLPPAEAPRAPR